VTDPAGDDGAPIPIRVQAAVYAAALFSAPITNVVAIVAPLWLLELKAGPVAIGFALGSFSVLTLLFAVHGGAVMDRLGARRVMLAFAMMGTVVPFLFPTLPWIWAVFPLQMLMGFAATMGWIGAQTLVGQIMRGRTVYAGRVVAVSWLGNIGGPPLAGLGWDLMGPWGGFAAVSVWAAGGVAAALALPDTGAPSARDGEAGATTAAPRLRLTDITPRLASYRDAFMLLAIPMVAFVIMVSGLRMMAQGIQNSFYIIYLNGEGISGLAIGGLVGAGSLVAAGFSLVVARLEKRIPAPWLLLVTGFGTIFFIAITPVLAGYFVFVAAQAGRGICAGLVTPLMLTSMSHAVGSAQGKAVALRSTANRLMGLMAPVIMGAMVGLLGLAESFYVMLGLAFASILAIAWYGRRQGII
jgi:MFS family permease